MVLKLVKTELSFNENFHGLNSSVDRNKAKTIFLAESMTYFHLHSLVKINELNFKN